MLELYQALVSASNADLARRAFGGHVADAGVGGPARKKKIQDDEWAYQKLIEQYAGFFPPVNFLSTLTPSMFYMDRRVACSALRVCVCALRERELCSLCSLPLLLSSACCVALLCGVLSSFSSLCSALLLLAEVAELAELAEETQALFPFLLCTSLSSLAVLLLLCKLLPLLFSHPVNASLTI